MENKEQIQVELKFDTTKPFPVHHQFVKTNPIMVMFYTHVVQQIKKPTK